MFRKKMMFCSVLISTFALTLSGVAWGAEWKQSTDGWQYIETDGSAVSGVWKQYNGSWFYLGDDGFMATDTLVADGDNYYYVGADGVMVKNTWMQLTDPDSSEGDVYWYYFGDTGKALRGNGNGKINTKNVDGKKYLFDTDAKMITGFVDENGDAIDSDTSNVFVEAKYLFGSDGAMLTDQWYKYNIVGEENLYSNLAQRSYNEYEEMWMFFDTNGKKVAAKDVTSAKTKTIEGKTYAFDENGIMMPGLSVKNATVPATSSNAVIRYGSLDTDGEQIGDFWAWTVPTEEMAEEDYDLQEFSWFRTKSNGKVYKDTIKSVYGRKYAFDELGRMQTGFVIMYDDGTFAIQYDIDEWNREDFLQDASSSPIPSIDRGNLYLFNIDELNDGSMITGKEIAVTLNDDEAVFGFKSNGKAYGSKCTLERVNKKYYYNGMRLDASADVKYGIVDTEESLGSTHFVVVDSKGKVNTSKKTVLKDGAEYWVVIQNGEFVARVSDSDKPRWHEGQYWHYDSELDGDDRYVAPITASEQLDNLDDDFVVFWQ